ncbi:MAG: hypothetical protein GY935_04985 [Gammaproteobacteria bacterium]|nr:hypothetical protein [Gammaproteobacteria bacterium]
MMLRCFSIVLLVSLGACATGSSKPGPADGSATVCPELRPRICTMDYTPVCAELQDAGSMTYPNACSACADVKVISHRAGACE